MQRKQSDHGCYHHQNTDSEYFLHGKVSEKEGATETTDGSEQEIYTGGKSGTGKSHVQTFH